MGQKNKNSKINIMLKILYMAIIIFIGLTIIKVSLYLMGPKYFHWMDKRNIIELDPAYISGFLEDKLYEILPDGEFHIIQEGVGLENQGQFVNCSYHVIFDDLNSDAEYTAKYIVKDNPYNLSNKDKFYITKFQNDKYESIFSSED